MSYRVVSSTVPSALLACIVSLLAVPQAPTFASPDRRAPGVVRDLFALELRAHDEYRVDSPVQIVARVFNPWDSVPFAGRLVEFAAVADDSDGDASPLPSARSCTTDEDGECEVTFLLPWRADGIEIAASAEGDGQSRSASIYLSPSEYPEVVLSTDRFVYRPGDTLHLRALARWPDRAFRGVVTLEGTDEQDRTLFSRAVATSQFGIAAMEWMIPEAPAPTEIYLTATDSESYLFASREVSVSTEPAPRFVVEVASDRSFYLPAETVRVAVTARGFTGDALGGATVRATLEPKDEFPGPRTVDRALSVAESEVAPLAETRLDVAGRAELVLPVSRLVPSDELEERGYQDATLAVEVTEPVSARTERRSLVVRVSRHALHAYLMVSARADARGSQVAWVTCCRADGEPATCAVDIHERITEGDERLGTATALEASLGARVGQALTNRLGVGSVRWRASGERGGRRQLVLVASDELGATGISQADTWAALDASVAILAPVLHRPGEPLEATVLPISSDERPPRITLELWRMHGRSAVRLERRRLGKLVAPATVRFEYRTEMQGSLLLAAHDLEPRSEDSRYYRRYYETAGHLNVLYVGGGGDESRAFSLELEPQRPEYRPGETATIALRANPTVEAVVGLAAVDVDLEELQRVRYGDSHRRAFIQEALENRTSLSLGAWSLERIAGLGVDELDAALASELEPLAALLLDRRDQIHYAWEEDSPIDEIRLAGRRHFERQWEWRESRTSPWGWVVPWHRLTVAELLDDESERLAQRVRSLFSEGSSFVEATGRATGLGTSAIADPWGTPYRYRGLVDTQWWNRFSACRLELLSAGLDRAWDTTDDHLVGTVEHLCFRPLARALDRWLGLLAVAGKRLPRDGEPLPPEVLDLIAPLEDRTALGLSVAGGLVLDPWGHELRLSWEWSRSVPALTVSSGSGYEAPGVRAQATPLDPLALFEGRLEQALRDAVAARQLPRADEGLTGVWQETLNALGLRALHDPWGETVLAFERSAPTKGFASVPRALVLRGPGPDSVQGTDDDLVLARFGCLGMRPAPWTAEVQEGELAVVSGVVTDHEGSRLPGAEVEICSLHGSETTVTDARGEYHFARQPPGPATVTARLEGFSGSQQSLEVEAGSRQQLLHVLYLGTAETITVTSEAPELERFHVTVGATVADRGPDTTPAAMPIATPLLRRDFRDTLVFVPELPLRDGRGEVEIPLADDVTTWSISAIASTLDGRLATATAELPVRLPFWLDSRLPRRVTAGDRISLPVEFHNLTQQTRGFRWQASGDGLGFDGATSGEVSLAPHALDLVTLEARFFDPGTSTLRIAARDAAAGAALGDAVERSLRVEPDAYRSREVRNVLAGGQPAGSSAVPVPLPDGNLLWAAEVEIRIYADLRAHLADAARALVARPHGCTEQVISGAWPSLLWLELAAAQTEARDAVMVSRARAFVEQAVETTLARRADGGVGYWPGNAPDLALSAYALGFLNRARHQVPVDLGHLAGIAGWLAGHLESQHALDHAPGREATDSLLVALELARALDFLRNDDSKRDMIARIEHDVAAVLERTSPSLDREEPYLVALWGLAALAVGTEGDAQALERASGAAELLVRLVDREGTQASWPVAGMTPFWGRAASARVETTGLAVQLLDRFPEHHELARAGAAWLLVQKVADGAWSSTQSTVQALRALVPILGDERVGAGNPPQPSSLIAVWLGGERLVVEPAGDDRGPLRYRASLPAALSAAGPTVRVQADPPVFVQVVTTSWVPWAHAEKLGHHERLGFELQCAPLRLAAGEPVDCRVDITREGLGGMLVAEIGLPPGAEVEREELRATRGWVRSWEVDEERVLAYVYPDRGAARLEIRFRPTLPLQARSTASGLSDYYDPDARIVLQPLDYEVDARPAADSPRLQ